MIAGPNGSGKSTLTKRLVADGVPLGAYVNPDSIFQGLDGPDDDLKVRRAQDVAERECRGYIARRENFTFETVMSHFSKITRLQAARAAGYRVSILFVALEPPKLNVKRVRYRVANHGHGVPEAKIIPRYKRCLNFLPAAIAECDRAILFDNSEREAGAELGYLAPFCEVRRTLAGDHRFYANGRELLRWRDEPALPRWSRGLITDAILSANEPR